MGFAQNTLVKWYKSDLQPTLVENHIVSASITGAKNQEWGIENAFYTTEGNYSSSSSPDLSKYIEFSVGPESTFFIQPSNFKFNARSQANNPKFQIRYSKSENFADAQVLLGETVATNSYVSYSLNFPADLKVLYGEKLYIRIYVYQANDNFHIQHNQSGSIAPSISGMVSSFIPTKPVAVSDKAETLINTPINIDILGNDDYAPSGVLNKITTTKPTNGTVVVNNVKDVTYTPDANYVGYDSFSYTITNSLGESNSAKVEIQVLEGSEIVLERWNKTDFMPVNYVNGITGSSLETAGGVSINNFNPHWISNVPYRSFVFSGLSTSSNLNGTLDPTKYIQFSVHSSLAEKAVVLRKLKLQYNAQGTGNFSVKYSKDPAFSKNVYTLVDGKGYTDTAYSQWNDVEENFATGTVINPNEKIYVRIYVFNASYSSASFFIKTGVANDSSILNGPVITGINADLHEEPCSKTAIWDGSAWSLLPNINRKVELNADYNTAIYGNFEACSVLVKAGKLNIAAKTFVTINNEINVSNGAVVEVQSDGNLVQMKNDVTNTGNISVLRELNLGNARNQYNYLGSPVIFAAGENLKTIYPRITSALSYNEWNNKFTSSNGVVNSGKGLALKEPAKLNAQDVTTTIMAKFFGVPQNGIVNYPLANSNVGEGTELGYNLVANPYPSNIDIKKLFELNQESGANTSATFYLWDNGVNKDIAQTQQGSSYSGQAYAVYNALAGKNGTGTSAAGYLNNNVQGKKVPSGIVSVGQGFVVQTLGKNQVLKFDNSIRTNADVEAIFLGKLNENLSEDNRFWIKMVTPANLTSSFAVVYFDGGNDGFGKEDSEAKGASDEIYTVMQNKKLAINGKAIFSDADQLALGSQHFSAGKYTIAIDKTEGVFANGQNIYLKDNQTGIVTNLTSGSYTFAANGGESTERFVIFYKLETTLSTDSVIKEEVVVYKDSEDFIIKAQSKKITDLQVYDMSGRMVLKSQPNSLKTNVSSSQLKNGVYILKISQNGTVTTKKVIK